MDRWIQGRLALDWVIVRVWEPESRLPQATNSWYGHQSWYHLVEDESARILSRNDWRCEVRPGDPSSTARFPTAYSPAEASSLVDASSSWRLSFGRASCWGHSRLAEIMLVAGPPAPCHPGDPSRSAVLWQYFNFTSLGVEDYRTHAQATRFR